MQAGVGAHPQPRKPDEGEFVECPTCWAALRLQALPLQALPLRHPGPQARLAALAAPSQVEKALEGSGHF